MAVGIVRVYWYRLFELVSFSQFPLPFLLAKAPQCKRSE